MRARSYLLVACTAVVIVGGVYLWRDAQGSRVAGPSADALVEAQARHAREVAPPTDGERLNRVRPPRSGEGAGVEPTGDLPRPRLRVPNMATLPPPPIDPPDRGAGAMQPPIDPDDPEAASAMTETNKMYDRGDYDGARTLAMKMLGKDPSNVRMLRVAVSSSCILGDADVAQKYWAQLPTPDQAQMAIRCARYQVTFPTAGAAPPPEK